jgi:hypothetical protein
MLAIDPAATAWLLASTALVLLNRRTEKPGS